MKTDRRFAFFFAPAILLCASCRRDMQDQPKYEPLQRSDFFTDGRASRPIPAGTVAQDELNDDDSYQTGEKNDDFLTTIPVAVDERLLHRGEDRFDIYCSPCHGRVGDGNGMIKQRGLQIPADLHTDRLRQVPPGYLYQVIAKGYGAMGGYEDQIDVRDRWAIVAYIRALQLSRHATLADVEPGTTELGGGQ